MNIEKVKINLIGQELVVEQDNENDRLTYRINFVVDDVDIKSIPCTNIKRFVFNNSSINLYFDDYEISPLSDDILNLYLQNELVTYMCLDGVSWEDILEKNESEDDEEVQIKKEILIALLEEFDCKNCIHDAGSLDCWLDETDEECPFIVAIDAIEFKEDN